MKDDVSHERLEVRLREELGRLARVPMPGLSERVLARLPERRTRSRRVALVLAAAAATLLLWFVATLSDERALPEGSPIARTQADDAPSASARRLVPWSPLAPEAPLVDEAQRLVRDTRRAAVSLWDRLPLTALLARETR